VASGLGPAWVWATGDAVGLAVGVGDAVGDGLACEVPPPATREADYLPEPRRRRLPGTAISRVLRLAEMRFNTNLVSPDERPIKG